MGSPSKLSVVESGDQVEAASVVSFWGWQGFILQSTNEEFMDKVKLTV